MIQIKPIGKNVIEIDIGRAQILQSYNTKVAAKINGKYYRTEQYYSATTSKHINAWLSGSHAEIKPQRFFDEMI